MEEIHCSYFYWCEYHQEMLLLKKKIFFIEKQNKHFNNENNKNKRNWRCERKYLVNNLKWKTWNMMKMKNIRHYHDRRSCAAHVKKCEREKKILWSEAFDRDQLNYVLMEYKISNSCMLKLWVAENLENRNSSSYLSMHE